jgi:hypothetical protein
VHIQRYTFFPEFSQFAYVLPFFDCNIILIILSHVVPWPGLLLSTAAESGDFPGREFIKAGDDTGFVAPTASQAEAGKHMRVASPEEAEDLEGNKSSNSSSDKEREAAISSVPISSTHPLREAKMSLVENYGIGIS